MVAISSFCDQPENFVFSLGLFGQVNYTLFVFRTGDSKLICVVLHYII